MKVGELIEILKKQDPKSNVMITDKNGLFFRRVFGGYRNRTLYAN